MFVNFSSIYRFLANFDRLFPFIDEGFNLYQNTLTINFIKFCLLNSKKFYFIGFIINIYFMYNFKIYKTLKKQYQNESGFMVANFVIYIYISL